jgi:hypothetical protein
MDENGEQSVANGGDQPKPTPATTPRSLSRSATECERRDRYRRLAEQIRQWMEEDPEYDEQVGKILERELYEERYGVRRADDTAA